MIFCCYAECHCTDTTTILIKTLLLMTLLITLKCDIECMFVFTGISSHLLVKSVVENIIISNVTRIKCYKYCHYKKIHYK